VPVDERLQRAGGRKFAIVVYSVVAIIVLRSMGSLSEELFAETLVYIIGIYVTGNVLQKADILKLFGKNQDV
jgi:hypothetical protein